MRRFLVTYSVDNVWQHITTNDIERVKHLYELFESGIIDELLMGQYETEDKKDE